MCPVATQVGLGAPSPQIVWVRWSCTEQHVWGLLVLLPSKENQLGEKGLGQSVDMLRRHSLNLDSVNFECRIPFCVAESALLVAPQVSDCPLVPLSAAGGHQQLDPPFPPLQGAGGTLGMLCPTVLHQSTLCSGSFLCRRILDPPLHSPTPGTVPRTSCSGTRFNHTIVPPLELLQKYFSKASPSGL